MSRLQLVTLCIGFIFVAIHSTAEYFELYFYYPWLDIPVHILGGLFIILMLHTVASLGLLRGRYATSQFFILSLGGLLVLWELYGIARYGGFKPDFISDTSLDILFGILGCVIGAFIYSLIQKQSS